MATRARRPSATEQRAHAAGAAPTTPPLPERDVRRKRPPALSFLLRMETLRRVARVVSLLALDFAGVFLAIFTALWLKARVRDALGLRDVACTETQGRTSPSPTWSPRCCSRAPACTPTAPSARACRGSSPRCSRSTVVALLFAVVNGEQFSELLHLLRHAVLRGRLRRRRSAAPTSASTGRAAARGRLPAPRGARRHRRAHRGRRPRAARRGARAGRGRRLHLAHAAARQRAALARARSRTSADGARRATASTRSSSPTPTSPQERGGRARRPVPPARRARCGSRRRRWRSSSTAPSSCPGQSVPLFELRPPVFEGFDYVAQAHVRPRRRRRCCCSCCQPAAAGHRARGAAHLARAGPLPLDAARASAASRSPA